MKTIKQPQGNEKSVKRVLTDLVLEVTHEFYIEPWDMDNIDQALKEIGDILYEAYDEDWYKYQSNVNKILKR